MVAVGIAICFGAVGFHLIEGWSLRDSLYVATQTVTTVGYGDLTPATRNGRLFSTIFMLFGVGVDFTHYGTVHNHRCRNPSPPSASDDSHEK